MKASPLFQERWGGGGGRDFFSFHCGDKKADTIKYKMTDDLKGRAYENWL